MVAFVRVSEHLCTHGRIFFSFGNMKRPNTCKDQRRSLDSLIALTSIIFIFNFSSVHLGDRVGASVIFRTVQIFIRNRPHCKRFSWQRGLLSAQTLWQCQLSGTFLSSDGNCYFNFPHFSWNRENCSLWKLFFSSLVGVSDDNFPPVERAASKEN